jgi:hypothetical protein
MVGRFKDILIERLEVCKGLIIGTLFNLLAIALILLITGKIIEGSISACILLCNIVKMGSFGRLSMV